MFARVRAQAQGQENGRTWDDTRDRPQYRVITLYATYNGLYRYQDNQTGMQYISSDVFALIRDGWTIKYID